jgi:peptide deformylase
MAVRNILRLGNPDLYRICDVVKETELVLAGEIVADLRDTLASFTIQTAPARAMAAPQIGEFKRIVYMHDYHPGAQPMVFINPVLSDLSDETFDMWDDCMSFPELLVYVTRHRTCRISFRDLEWKKHTMELTELSELLQHEVDHLNGILAISRAVDTRSIALRSERKFLDGRAVNG